MGCCSRALHVAIVICKLRSVACCRLLSLVMSWQPMTFVMDGFCFCEMAFWWALQSGFPTRDMRSTFCDPGVHALRFLKIVRLDEGRYEWHRVDTLLYAEMSSMAECDGSPSRRSMSSLRLMASATVLKILSVFGLLPYDSWRL